jgi:DNA adenine methylase
MNFYRVVRDQAEELINQAIEYRYEKTEYYSRRSRFNEHPEDAVEDAALLLYLNRTGYNGLYRVNSRGLFNVPFGRYKEPTIIYKDRIRKASRHLQKIKIFNEDFTYILKLVKKGDICYLDPPYYPLSITADFTNYSEAGFDSDDHIRLRKLCYDLDEIGAIFVQSNSDTGFIHSLYEDSGFKIIKLKTNRMISSKVSSRSSGIDLLITNRSLSHAKT